MRKQYYTRPLRMSVIQAWRKSNLTRKARFQSRRGTVYLIKVEGTDRHRIGMTRRLGMRLSLIQPWSPFPLEVVMTIDSENGSRLKASLHKKYERFRARSEWFDLPAWAVAEIESATRQDETSIGEEW